MRKWWTIVWILKLPVHIFQNVYVNIKRILGMAQRLCDAGHYASNTIRMQAGQLEREWKSLAAAVEDRSVVLNMSVNFYKKAEQVRSFFSIQNSFKILVAYKTLRDIGSKVIKNYWEFVSSLYVLVHRIEWNNMSITMVMILAEW